MEDKKNIIVYFNKLTKIVHLIEFKHLPNTKETIDAFLKGNIEIVWIL